MTPERWRQVTEVFHAARSRDAAARATYLDHACADDRALRDEVDAMLAAHHDPGGFDDRPVSGLTEAVRRLDPGAMVGPYRIDRLIGAGGMGEVYRARDTKLGRDVAIKVLPDAFTSDPERLRRFEREARVLATLNHPHIGAIYGFEEARGVRALILELVEGPTLAERLARGSGLTAQGRAQRDVGPGRKPSASGHEAGPSGLTLNEVLPIARQICEALEAAHEKGIIHRDLKPANIKVTPAGVVKVLDFGLAKAFVGDGSGPDLSQLPTVTIEGTREGIIAGTPAYMSPEQARGQAVDKRTDIWAFGCVLYEMLTGKRAFEGEDVSETLACIINREPDFAALPKKTPAPIAKLLRRCLEKDPKRRVPDIAVARFEMDEALTMPAGATELPPVRPLRMWQRPLPLVAGIVVLLGVTLFGFWAITRPSPPRVVRLTVTLSGATALDIGSFGPPVAISPDGTRLAYVGAGAQGIVVRALDELQPTTLPGLGAPAGPFFSPDGQWIGFFDGGGALKKVAATGGAPVTVSRITFNPRGASWSTDDSIIFATSAASGLLRVGASGGEPEVLTTPNQEQGELDHFWPEVLPGGQAVLFTIRTAGGDQIAVLDLTTREQKILIRGGTFARYVPTGHLVYSVAGALRAVAFDLSRLEVVGTPVPVLEEVMTSVLGVAYMSLSHDGTLVYVPGGALGLPSTLVWVDRQGREEPIKAPLRYYIYPRISPDGMRVALDLVDQQGRDIWIWDLARETLTRLTFDPGSDSHPVWTPDGRRVVFRSSRALNDNLFWQAADGTGAVERLTDSPNIHFASAFSPNGTRLVFREETATTGLDLMVLALDGGRRAQPPSPGVGGPGRSATSDVRPLVQTTFNELNAEISPDGRWVAYQSNESGEDEIYVRPFPDADRGRWQISTGGGTRPLWAHTGRELFYTVEPGRMMAVPIQPGLTFAAGNPQVVFEGAYLAPQAGRTYDVSPDGKRFLMIKEAASTDATSAPREIVVVQNWFEELKRLVPAK